MSFRTTLLSSALLLGLAFPSVAAPWILHDDANFPVSKLNPGQWAGNNYTDNSDTPVLDVSSCRVYDTFFYLDKNADGTVATGMQTAIKHCAPSLGGADVDCPTQANVTLTGLTTAAQQLNQSGIKIFGDVSGTFAADPYLLVFCKR